MVITNGHLLLKFVRHIIISLVDSGYMPCVCGNQPILNFSLDRQIRIVNPKFAKRRRFMVFLFLRRRIIKWCEFTLCKICL